MDLTGSHSEECLKAAYAGESQAKNKYTYASKAKNGGFSLNALVSASADSKCDRNELPSGKTVFIAQGQHMSNARTALGTHMNNGKAFAVATEKKRHSWLDFLDVVGKIEKEQRGCSEDFNHTDKTVAFFCLAEALDSPIAVISM